MSKGKKAKRKPSPSSSPGKTRPSPHSLPGSATSADRLCWRFRHVDQDGPWGLDDSITLSLLDHLAAREEMTVSQVFQEGQGGKDYDVDKIPNPEARERLEAINLGDMAKISALRVSGRGRLFGFLVGNVFHVVWWDPRHEVWP